MIHRYARTALLRMNSILILSLLFPLSLMAMEDQDLDGTLHIESRLHYLQDGYHSIFVQHYIPGRITIIYAPKKDLFTYNKDQQCFVDSNNGEIGTYARSLLDFDRYSENRGGLPYYTFQATILGVTKQGFRYRCTVDKSDKSGSPYVNNVHETSIPFPANDACTRCKLIFTNVEEKPTVIYPHTMTLQQKQTLMATLEPKLWINIKAEYVPKDGSPKYMTRNLTDTDVE